MGEEGEERGGGGVSVELGEIEDCSVLSWFSVSAGIAVV